MADKIDQAVRIFERGDIAGAAAEMRNARMEALSHRDDAQLAAIDQTLGEMRAHLDQNDLDLFNKHVRYALPTGEEEAFPNDEDVDVSPIGLAIALVGALAMLVAVFLPYADAQSFARVAENTLIQHGAGWWFIGIALSGAVAIFRAYNRRRASPGPIVLGIVAIGVAIYYGTSSSSLKLCVVGSNPLSIPCETASPGIGLYIAGIGGLLMAVGGVQMLSARRTTAKPAVADEATKTCPECAETVKAAARVCKHCGHRFAPAT